MLNDLESDRETSKNACPTATQREARTYYERHLPGGTESGGQPFCSIDSVSVAMLPIERNSRGFQGIGLPKHGA
jgi:hypothetical protein